MQNNLGAIFLCRNVHFPSHCNQKFGKGSKLDFPSVSFFWQFEHFKHAKMVTTFSYCQKNHHTYKSSNKNNLSKCVFFFLSRFIFIKHTRTTLACSSACEKWAPLLPHLNSRICSKKCSHVLIECMSKSFLSTPLDSRRKLQITICHFAETSHRVVELPKFTSC